MAAAASVGNALFRSAEVLPVTEARVIASAAERVGWKLVPSELDQLGPFYSRTMKPLTDARSDKALVGHELLGTILDAKTGSPVQGARIEAWSVLPNAKYSHEADRGWQLLGDDAKYSYRSDYPVPYMGRPSHVHLLAEAPGYHSVVTQQYPTPSEAKKVFDVVLEPVLPGQQRSLKVIPSWTPYQPERPSGFVGPWNGPE